MFDTFLAVVLNVSRVCLCALGSRLSRPAHCVWLCCLQALNCKEWGLVRLIPGSRNGGEPLAFYSHGSEVKLKLDEEQEAEFRDRVLEALYRGVENPDTYRHLVDRRKAKQENKIGDGAKTAEEIAKDKEDDLKHKEDEDALLRELSVNMRSVSLVRLRHGRGACISAPPEKSLFTGQWWLGAAVGPAVEVTKSGVFDGLYEHGRRVAKGSFKFADGTTYEGQWGNFATRKRIKSGDQRPSPQFRFGPMTQPQQLVGSPYLTGMPHGYGIMRFLDGSQYVGQLRDGVITGAGRYTDANGDIMEGEFLNGMLHGQGIHYFRDGTVYSGTWKHGLLVREASILKYNGDVYVGSLAGNVPDGMGTLIERGGSAVYEGEFCGGHREGRGVQVYRNQSVDTATMMPVDNFAAASPSSIARKESEADVGKRSHRCQPMQASGGYVAEGRWRGGVLSRGAITAVKTNAATDTLFARKLRETLAPEGSTLAKAAATHNSWMRTKADVIAKDPRFAKTIRPTLESLSRRVDGVVARAIATVNGEKAPSLSEMVGEEEARPGTALLHSPTRGHQSLADRLLAGIRRPASSSGSQHAVPTVKSAAKAQMDVASSTGSGPSFSQTGNGGGSSDLFHYSHGLSPWNNLMFSSTGAGRCLPAEDQLHHLRNHTDEQYKEAIRMWMSGRKEWLDTMRERQDECVDEHWSEYRSTRRLWKREVKERMEAMDVAIRERERRMAAANEDVERWQEEFEKL